AGALHHGLPIGVGHVRYEYVAGLHAVHLGDVANDLHRAGADALADRTALDQHGALFLQQVALHDIGAAAALHGFRTRLDDVQLAVVPVLGPLDIHRAAVVSLDDQRLAGQVADFFVGEAEACAVGLVDIDRLDRLARAGFGAIDHLDGLAAQVAPQDRWAAGFEGVLVHIEFVGVHRTLHHGFTQPVGAGDEHHVAEARFGIQREHHASGAGFGTHHALHASGQGYQLVVEALVHAVGNGAVVEQRSENFLGGADHIVHATNIEEGFLLAGEGGVRQILGGCRRAHRHRQIFVTR